MAGRSVSPQAEILYEKAQDAFSRQNYDYTITLLFSALDIADDYSQARNLLHNAALKRYEEAMPIIKKVFLLIPNGYNLLKSIVLMKKEQWIETINLLEKSVCNNPKSRHTLYRLSLCFEHLNDEKMAKDILEFLRHIHPSDIRTLKELGRLSLKEKKLDKARMYYEEVLHYSPVDTDAQKGLKDIAAMKTIEKGGWDDTSTYRDKIRDEEKADIYEKEHRSVQSETDIKLLITNKEKTLSKNPHNVSLIKEIADLFTKVRDYEKAKTYYKKAIEKNPSDAGLHELMADVQIKEFDYNISNSEEKLNEYPGESGLKKELDNLKKAKEDFILSNSEEMVRKYPNNLPLRYKLGLLYYEKGRTRDALQQFQYAVKDPHRRLNSHNYMGLCFIKEKKYDLAVKRFTIALEGAPEMDSFTKELTYNLGTVYELMKEHNKAILEFKKIYEVDIAYRDVAEKIEKAYE